MPFAPPVTIAVRPDSLAMALFLCAHAADELFEGRKLKLDHVDRRLILELEGLLVELLPGKRDDHLGPAEQKRHRPKSTTDAGDAACASRRECRRRPIAAPPACP